MADVYKAGRVWENAIAIDCNVNLEYFVFCKAEFNWDGIDLIKDVSACPLNKCVH